jgi:rhodanese-related sulfurtransferase
MRKAIIYLAGAVAGPLLLFAVAVLALTWTFDHYPNDRGMLWLAVAIGAVGFSLFYLLADLTSVSLHPFYKRRLSTAFALKRVAPADVSHQRDQAGLPQEREEGIAVERDFDRHVPLSKTALDRWPSLIVCAAANISDPGATPPGRRVTSFTFSANTVGGPLVGAMETTEYEQSFGNKRQRDFSLPAAVAMSGAAIAPSMGKATRPAFRFLLALANIRLGVWVPNPRWVASASKRERAVFRQPRPSYLIRELLGRNRVDGKYLYVTDGGHYENLGLVELLRRGCTRVFCFDASGGDKFSELGDAVALARSELGVKIEIDPTPLSPRGSPPTALRATTTGTIYYPDGSKGYIVYARNVMSPGGPWDVRAHQLDDPKFPHDSTVDQLYTDQKFESYRALGAQAGKQAVERMSEISPRIDAGANGNGDPALPPQRVRELLETASAQLVDIRDAHAYALVRIDGAIHIERGSLPAKKSELCKDHPLVFHCDEGLASAEVARDFAGDGWRAYNIEGGIRRWIDDGFPVQRSAPSGLVAE